MGSWYVYIYLYINCFILYESEKLSLKMSWILKTICYNKYNDCYFQVMKTSLHVR